MPWWPAEAPRQSRVALGIKAKSRRFGIDGFFGVWLRGQDLFLLGKNPIQPPANSLNRKGKSINSIPVAGSKRCCSKCITTESTQTNDALGQRALKPFRYP